MAIGWQEKTLKKIKRESQKSSNNQNTMVELIKKYNVTLDDMFDRKVDWSKWTKTDLSKWLKTPYGHLTKTV